MHCKSVLRDSEKNPNKFWKMIKTIFPTKTKEPPARSFNIDAKCTTNKKSIASGFCPFLSKIAGAWKEESIRFKNFIWSPLYKAKTKTRIAFKLIPITVSDVFVKPKKLKYKKAAGPDNLPPGFLKDIAIIIAKSLAHVINLSIATGIVPSGFKIGLITPVYKSGPKNDMDNYCPNTALPVCSKIFEHCICKQLNDFLESNNLLSNHQFGFRSNRNTESAVTLFTDHIRKSMNDEKLTGSIFIDLSKAFDTLSHAQILENLPSTGVKGVEYELFQNYLFNRKQTVIYDGVASDPQYVLSDVPQGSVPCCSW